MAIGIRTVRTFFVHDIVMSLLAGTRRPDEIVVVDQTDPKERDPFAFAELKKLETESVCRIVERPW